MAALEVLAAAGADLGQANKQGLSPLCMAVHKKMAKAVEVLLDSGADRAHQTQWGTAHDLAVGHGAFDPALVDRLKF